MNDERLGLPSASSRARDSRCPGALNLINKLRAEGRLKEETTPWAESGTRIHADAAGEDVELTTSEEATAEALASRLAQLREQLGVPDDAEEFIEERLWFYGTYRDCASGKPDRIWVFDDTAVVPDLKSGFAEVEPEDINLQFRAYAVLVKYYFPYVKRVIVATVARFQKAKPVEYDEDALELAKQEWLREIDASMEPDAPRIAGKIQCKWCPAKAHCDVATGKALEFPEETVGVTIQSSQQEIVEKVASMSNAELSEAVDQIGFVDSVCDALKRELRSRLESGNCDGIDYTLAPGKTKHPITDLGAVYLRCVPLGITPHQFTAACTVSKKNLTELLKTATGLKGKALEDYYKQITAGATTEKQDAPTLKKLSRELLK